MSKTDRIRFTVSCALKILLAGILYYVFISVTGKTIPCLFRSITGLKCPGCGITTLCRYLIKFRVVDAVKCNIGLTLLFPFICHVIARETYNFVNCKQSVKNYEAVAIIIMLLIWGVIRNIVGI